MASGVFDLLHPGHIYFLEQSKKLGDELVVLLTNDMVASRTKGELLFDQASRAHMVQALACVDQAIVATETEPTNYYKTVLAIRPDIIALGYDQTFTEQALAADLAAHGWQGKIVRLGQYHQPVSSSQLKNQIRNQKPA